MKPIKLLKTICYAMPSKDHNKLLRNLRKAGYTVNRDFGVTIRLGDKVIYRALEMARGYWTIKAVDGLLSPS